MSRLTVAGAVLGTPGYLAPEQARGDAEGVGPAADVYGLGAILYAALTGRPPFLAESPLATLQQVETAEPAPPSRLQPGLPRDLEIICLKCLHKEPARRYASAAALAEDLRRFLCGEPILARPVGWVEQTWRWCRRRPGVAALLAALLLVVVGALGGMTHLWQNAVTSREHADGKAREATASADRAAQLLLEAEAARKRAEENATLFEQTNMELLRLSDGSMAQWPEEAKRAVISALLQLQQTFQRELTAGNRDWRLRRQLALVCTHLAIHRRHSGQIEKAEDAIEMALGLWQELLTRAPNDDICLEGLGDSYLQMGFKHMARGQPDQALAAFHQAWPVWRQLHPRCKTRKIIQTMLACVVALANHLADTVRAHGNPVPVEDYVTAARACVADLLRKSDASPAEHRATVAMMLGHVSRRLRKQGALQEARQVAEKARATCTTIHEIGLQDVLPAVFLSEAWTEIAKVYWDSTEHPVPLAALQQALAVMRRAHEQNPSHRAWRLMHADRWYRRGRFLCDRQRLTEAEMCFLEQHRLGRDDHKVLGQVHRELLELVALLEKDAEAMSSSAKAAQQRCLAQIARVESDQAIVLSRTNEE